MVAARAGTARILGCHRNEHTTVPSQLIIQLATELEPALIEDGFVQTRFGPNLCSRLPDTLQSRDDVNYPALKDGACEWPHKPG